MVLRACGAIIKGRTGAAGSCESVVSPAIKGPPASVTAPAVRYY
jgi:hypothetical protein